MTTTTSYGYWSARVSIHHNGPDDLVSDYVASGHPEWKDLLAASGALERIHAEYRRAIDTALPADISLCGNEFIGPAHPEDGEFDDCPRDENGALDFAAMVEDIDLAEIIERNEPLTLEEIGRDVMTSKAKEPAKAASKAMSRLGVKPAYGYLPNPDSGRPQALYRAGDVRKALASRPGQGSRTDRTA
ncbi:hypothetical protein ABZ508_33240 [Streptomyces lavendulocolor]|uniref:Uncharacterized protein n=1 Tax=Streptomyces lavendulocolor TaxID=67316 RepID=A0ABV2WFT0_9ACTN